MSLCKSGMAVAPLQTEVWSASEIALGLQFMDKLSHAEQEFFWQEIL